MSINFEFLAKYWHFDPFEPVCFGKMSINFEFLAKYWHFDPAWSRYTRQNVNKSCNSHKILTFWLALPVDFSLKCQYILFMQRVQIILALIGFQTAAKFEIKWSIGSVAKSCMHQSWPLKGQETLECWKTCFKSFRNIIDSLF